MGPLTCHKWKTETFKTTFVFLFSFSIVKLVLSPLFIYKCLCCQCVKIDIRRNLLEQSLFYNLLRDDLFLITFPLKCEKGSTCTFTESILRSCGFRTGLFTSPHLIDVRERFRLDGWVFILRSLSVNLLVLLIVSIVFFLIKPKNQVTS